jgi:hypothetical protein
MSRVRMARPGNSRWLAAACLAAVAALPVSAQQEPVHAQPASTFLRWVWIACVFAAIWVFLYKLIYPLLVRHYRPDASKALFWTLFWLYSVTWMQLVLYFFFDYGFRYIWIGAIALLFSVLFLIAFLVVLLRHPG